MANWLLSRKLRLNTTHSSDQNSKFFSFSFFFFKKNASFPNVDFDQDKFGFKWESRFGRQTAKTSSWKVKPLRPPILHLDLEWRVIEDGSKDVMRFDLKNGFWWTLERTSLKKISSNLKIGIFCDVTAYRISLFWAFF